MAKHRDIGKILEAVENLIETMCDSPDLLKKLAPILDMVPTEGFTRQEVWRLEQAKSYLQQRLLLLG